MKTAPKALLSLAVIAALWCGFASAQSLKKPTDKSRALALDDIRGRRIRLDDYKGKVVLLNFWATWCVPCRQEIPDLIKLQRAHRNNLQVIGITYPPENANEVRRFARKLKMNYPVAIGTKETKTVFTASETLPVTVVIDRDGIVRDVIEGIMYADEFKEKVEPLLATVRAGEPKPPPAVPKPR